MLDNRLIDLVPISTKINKKESSKDELNRAFSFAQPLPKVLTADAKKRPQTTWSRESRDHMHRPSSSLSSPVPAPMSHRELDITKDDKTYISVLKSDILILQKKISDVGLTKGAKTSTEQAIGGLHHSFNSSENLATKATLLEILLDKLMELQKSILNRTENVRVFEFICNLNLQQSAKDITGSFSGVSRLPVFFASADRAITLHEQYLRQKESISPKKTASSPVNSIKTIPKKSISVQTTPFPRKSVFIQTDSYEQPSAVTTVEKVVHVTDNTKIETLQRQIEATTSQIKILEKNVKLLEKDNKSLSEKLSKSSDDNNKERNSAENEIEKLNKRISDLNNKVSEKKERDSEIVALKGHVKELTEASKHGDKQVEEELKQKAKINSLNDKLTAEKANSLNLEKQKSHLQQQIINIKEKNMNFGSLSKKDQNELQRLRDIEVKYNELQNQDTLSDGRLLKLQQYLERVEDGYKMLQEETTRLRDKNILLEQSDILYKDALEELKSERNASRDLELRLENGRNDRTHYEATLKTLSTRVEKAEKNSIIKDKECEKLQRELQSEKIHHQRTKSQFEMASRSVLEKEDEIEKLNKLTSPSTNMIDMNDTIAMLMKAGENSINEVLVNELKNVRQDFEKKLKTAGEEVNRIQTNYEKQLLELYETVKMERNVMDRKVRKFQERCEYLEKRLQEFEKSKK
ncbi:laminin-like protein [Acrasis kona]|uniref:Laminin-like protein n=1 Tax=Acrasis kona TaxID=1008807 RepID=A0AAW2Z9I0_9EUKA